MGYLYTLPLPVPRLAKPGVAASTRVRGGHARRPASAAELELEAAARGFRDPSRSSSSRSARRSSSHCSGVGQPSNPRRRPARFECSSSTRATPTEYRSAPRPCEHASGPSGRAADRRRTSPGRGCRSRARAAPSRRRGVVAQPSTSSPAPSPCSVDSTSVGRRAARASTAPTSAACAGCRRSAARSRRGAAPAAARAPRSGR